jgi:hypothetical protein
MTAKKGSSSHPPTNIIGSEALGIFSACTTQTRTEIIQQRCSRGIDLYS